MFEIKKILKNITIEGVDISKHAIKNSKKEVKKYLKRIDINKYKFKGKYDLIISINTLHNLEIDDLSKVVKKIVKFSKNS